MPFRFTSGGGRELSFQDDRDVELGELVAAQLPKAPLDTTIRGEVGLATGGRNKG